MTNVVCSLVVNKNGRLTVWMAPKTTLNLVMFALLANIWTARAVVFAMLRKRSMGFL
jgi:hypothetical protein